MHRVIGVFGAIVLCVIPFNKSAFPVLITCGTMLAGILLYYGKPMGANLWSGMIVSVIVLALLLGAFM